jgi:hypothetical protein
MSLMAGGDVNFSILKRRFQDKQFHLKLKEQNSSKATALLSPVCLLHKQLMGM